MKSQERGTIKLWFSPIVVIVAAVAVGWWFIQKWIEKGIFEKQMLGTVSLCIITGAILVVLLIIWHLRTRHRKSKEGDDGQDA